MVGVPPPARVSESYWMLNDHSLGSREAFMQTKEKTYQLLLLDRVYNDPEPEDESVTGGIKIREGS